MARHGENIRKRKDGRWEGRYLVYSEERGRKLYRSVYGRTYEAVKETLTMKKISLLELKGEIAEDGARAITGTGSGANDTISNTMNGRVPGKGKSEDNLMEAHHSQNSPYFQHLQIPELAEKWLDEVKRTKKQSTYVKYSLIYRTHLNSLLQDVSVFKLNDVLDWEKIFGRLSEGIQKSISCVLNQILKFASRQYHIAIPAWDKPVFHTRNKPVKVLTQKEQAALLSVLYQKVNRTKMAILLCFHTGLRLGELCALKWKDIDFEHNLISVNQTVQRLYAEGRKTKTALLETAPKSEYSRREIPLPSMFLELFAKFPHDEEYVFGQDRPLEPRTLQNRFKRLLEKAGVKHKNFHILRHTFATNCIEEGTDVKSLSEILGHSDVQISLNRYVHPPMDSKRKYLDSLSQFYRQIQGKNDRQVCSL